MVRAFSYSKNPYYYCDFSVDRSTANEQRNQCAVCNSLQLAICACKSRYTVQNVNINKLESNLLESSVDATGLEDVPGRVFFCFYIINFRMYFVLLNS